METETAERRAYVRAIKRSWKFEFEDDETEAGQSDFENREIGYEASSPTPDE